MTSITCQDAMDGMSSPVAAPACLKQTHATGSKAGSVCCVEMKGMKGAGGLHTPLCKPQAQQRTLHGWRLEPWRASTQSRRRVSRGPPLLCPWAAHASTAAGGAFCTPKRRAIVTKLMPPTMLLAARMPAL